MRVLTIILAVVLLATAAFADWFPGDGHKMHFPQLPDEAGWNVKASFGNVLADDWMCSESGPVTDIHFWGSWFGGNTGAINGFQISIYADIPDPDLGDPGTFSQPGQQLWTRYFNLSDVVVRHITPLPQVWEGWYDPVLEQWLYPDHDNYFQYNITNIAGPFLQTMDEIYWLSIEADVAEGADPQPLWGWKSSTEHFNDNAVYTGGVVGGSCVVPDNGTGTADMPADCDFTSPDEVFMIIDGLPPGTTIEMDGILMDFICTQSGMCSGVIPPGECEAPGGSLGGTLTCFEATLDLTVSGTGELTGFNRHLAVPVFLEVHHGPRTPGDPEQVFMSDVFRLQGELFGDPDFCTFQIVAGTDFGLPSPGQTVVTDLGNGTYNIDSFFDITYQIEFEGCPGSQLEDYMGTTTATIRMEQGGPVSDPVTPGSCVAPDNGGGTSDWPADCDFASPDEVWMIIDGLPPGTTIELDGPLTNLACDGPTLCSAGNPPGVCEQPGGSLGGTISCFSATLDVAVAGTGDLTGFNRHLAIPVEIEVHTGPRIPGDPVQSFSTDMFRLQGELFGDPDFCTFRVLGGTDFGLPSPGQSEITQLPNGDFNIDSFFDITYQIEFEGCPGSQLEDLMGTTTGTIRVNQGGPVTGGWAPMDEPPAQQQVVNAFWFEVGPDGVPMGGGENAYGDGWYFYPEFAWWNIWFYDHPLALDRYKEVLLVFDIFTTGPGSFAEIAVNWSTDAWSLIGNPPGERRPPLPGEGPEELFIGRQTVFQMPEPMGHYEIPMVIDQYNPEWVSIDIRGINYTIPQGFIIHECAGYGVEPLDLAFVITNTGGTSCCLLRADANHDGVGPDIADLVYMVNFMFNGGPKPPCEDPVGSNYFPECDVNGDGAAPDIADLVYLVNYMFNGGPAPVPCP
ncbi:MAG: hypothetical protein ABIE70_00790 [bacterium]